MSEILTGVIIGGLIASIGPVTTLLLDHKRWKHEAKLEYLKSERTRFEQLYSETLEKLSEAMANNLYPSQMASDILIFMPKSISDKYIEWIKEDEKNDSKGRSFYMDIAIEMKLSLKEIDKQIRDLVSK